MQRRLTPPTPHAKPDAPADAQPDAFVGINDAEATACCCDGDEQDPVMCSATGERSCRSGFGLHFGDDCSGDKPGGPCTLPGPDSGLNPDAGEAGHMSDAGDAGH